MKNILSVVSGEAKTTPARFYRTGTELQPRHKLSETELFRFIPRCIAALYNNFLLILSQAISKSMNYQIKTPYL